MSEISRARAIIELILRCEDLPFAKQCARQALGLMKREKPQFVSPARYPRLTESQKDMARKLRDEGLALNLIAIKLGTNIGRVSEAVNPERYNGKGL